MNLILFERNEVGQILPPEDPRTVHIRAVLNKKPGDSFDCGITNGPRGEGTVESDSRSGIRIRFQPIEEPPPLDPLWLLVGLTRPQTVRKILFEATTMGIERLLFFRAEKAQRSYAQSSLWRDGTVRRQLIAAAEQAFCTRLPEVGLLGNLAEAMSEVSGARAKIALDNYEATQALTDVVESEPPFLVAIGPERGWSTGERHQLRDNGFTIAHIGPRVLRTETACVASVALVKNKLGVYSADTGTPPGCTYSG